MVLERIQSAPYPLHYIADHKREIVPDHTDLSRNHLVEASELDSKSDLR